MPRTRKKDVLPFYDVAEKDRKLHEMENAVLSQHRAVTQAWCGVLEQRIKWAGGRFQGASVSDAGCPGFFDRKIIRRLPPECDSRHPECPRTSSPHPRFPQRTHPSMAVNQSANSVVAHFYLPHQSLFFRWPSRWQSRFRLAYRGLFRRHQFQSQ